MLSKQLIFAKLLMPEEKQDFRFYKKYHFRFDFFNEIFLTWPLILIIIHRFIIKFMLNHSNALPTQSFMAKLLFFLLALVPSYSVLMAQIPACPNDMLRDRFFMQNPTLQSNEDDMNLWIENETERLWQQRATNSLEKSGGPDEALYVIPIVVHIVHLPADAVGIGSNVSENRIYDAVNYLNDAYGNRNLYDPASGSDMKIQFCLAAQTPAGQASNGITRHSSLAYTTMDMAGAEDSLMKQQTGWDRDRYLNIWVVASIVDTDLGINNVAGYSSFPDHAGTNYDGVVIRQDYFGTDYINSKVVAHEIGHYFGLYHTFRGGCLNNTCLGQGDYVCDTPPDALSSATQSCTAINSCATDDDDHNSRNPFRPISAGGLGDVNDPIENYMDYGGYACQTHFTEGQKDRMRLVIELYRSDLVQSNGCQTIVSNDIGIADLVQPCLFGCGNDITVRLYNYGINTVNSATIGYQIDFGATVNFNWTGNLPSGQAIDVWIGALPPSLSQAKHTLQVFAASPNGLPDGTISNNSNTFDFYKINTFSLPFFEDFETATPSGKWLTVNNDNDITWAKANISSCSDNGNKTAWLNHYTYTATAQKDYFYTKLDLNNYENAVLSFSVAYARPNNNLSDKLRVAISTDCGFSFNEIYYKEGNQLATVVAFEPTSWQPNSCTQWRSETINLQKYVGNEVVLAFEAINFHANNLYIDNIAITGEVVSPCQIATSINVNNLTANSALLSWAGNGTQQFYNVRYRLQGTEQWTEIAGELSPLSLNDLYDNSTYEWQIQSLCGGGLSTDYGEVYTFTTPNDPCPIPYNLRIGYVDATMAIIDWDDPADATSYKVYFKPTGTSVLFGPFLTNESQYTLNGLTTGQNYTFQVVTVCNTFQSVEPVTLTFTPAPACNMPIGLIATNVTENSAILSWEGDDDAISYKVEYGILGSGFSNNINIGQQTHTLTGLNNQTLYEARVRTYCNGSYSDFSPSIVFQTGSPCTAPTNFQLAQVETDHAVVAWESVSSAAEYKVLFKRKGVILWDTLDVVGSAIAFENLESCTQYILKIRSVCNTTSSGYSPIFSFTTNDEEGYCCALAETSIYWWIDKVKFGALWENYSGNNGGYADFTAQQTLTFSKGQLYNFALTPGFSRKSGTRTWAMWIDYNANQQFEPNEQQYNVLATGASGGLGSANPYTSYGSIQIPNDAVLGPTRMRVLLRADVPSEVCGAYTSGEVEDYTIIIGPGKTADEYDSSNSNHAFRVTAHPNPASNSTQITCRGIEGDRAELTLFDFKGQILRQQTATARTGTYKALWTDFSLDGLPEGIYLLSVLDVLTGSSSFVKIVVVK